MRFGLILLCLSAASPASARDPVLSVPLKCTLGLDCYIQNYVDADPSPGAADFTCGTLSYDGHTGTDFALPTVVDMWNGVEVLAAAPGTVTATRDGMDDYPQGVEAAPDVSGKECGNGVVVDHGGGWNTQYCHMMNGSIQVKKGQRVTATTVLGKVGLSGQTQFPHVHLAVRHDGKVVDPFNPEGVISCGPEAISNGTLWNADMNYVPGGLLSIGVSTEMPAYDMVKAGTAGKGQFSTSDPALVVFGFAYGGLADDIMRLSISGPEGELVGYDAPIEKAQAQLFRGAGKRSPGAWPPGGYRAMVQLIRNDHVIDQRQFDFAVTE